MGVKKGKMCGVQSVRMGSKWVGLGFGTGLDWVRFEGPAEGLGCGLDWVRIFGTRGEVDDVTGFQAWI